MKRTSVLITLILATSILYVGCKKEETKPEPDPPAVNQPDPIAKLDLLADTWILFETFKNGTVVTSNGTDLYEFTRNGRFRFKSTNGWSNIGNFTFSGDSSSINMVFVGTSNSIPMKLDQLDESLLITKFPSGSNNYEYKYRRK